MGWRAQDAWDSENKALLDEIKYRKSTVWKPAILWFFLTAGFIFFQLLG